ncbi:MULTISPECIES: methylenetetrahydrofolate reductase [NAD(P)H] [unclassified Sedimentibacter]|uniref:methylenetetrahydrofolate reductase [NAD(P)H] n=1 Tax=unclassified Sedimentibacter TaxID=2649220 RepID=UPI0027E07059|nr:methylenetetrahydrofolate reductase [NAD(P)H] [Sedimentibacter sp. MB35-C1]WMJ76716.1 methylenetetrahydrofolate reductase [NAD(P)H] [Sedimentibacter sp. MB35-C1]
MFIKDIFNKKKFVFSFEIFPPKATSPIDTVYKTMEALSDLRPDYISVTYGAGGGSNQNKTSEISSMIKNRYGIEALAHLTCISSTEDDIKEVLKELKKENIDNILALRGDIPLEQDIKGDFKHSSDLAKFITENECFDLGGTCYPEGHYDSKNIEEDVINLKKKIEAGVTHLTSQLFYDNNAFYEFMNLTVKHHINVPIQAGIMPVTNKKQIERIVELSGTKMPERYIKIMDKFEYDKDAMADAGIAYATDQIIDLMSNGVAGVHLYTMNNPYIARKTHDNIISLVHSINRK